MSVGFGRFPSPQQHQIIAAFTATIGVDGSPESQPMDSTDDSEHSKLVVQPSLLDGVSFPVR